MKKYYLNENYGFIVTETEMNRQKTNGSTATFRYLGEFPSHFDAFEALRLNQL